MQKAYRQATSGLIGLAIGAGCGGSSPGTTATEPASVEYVEQSIQQSLDRLEALSIVHVGRLVLDLPAEATSCYGLPPCPGAEEPYRVERARQAPRVAHLASIAEAMRDRYVVPHDKSEAGAALEALAALNVVQVTGLVEAKPANNPECYNLPCGSDIEAADRENAKRVAQVFAIVAAAKAGGL